MLVETKRCPLNMDYLTCKDIHVPEGVQCRNDSDCEGNRKCCWYGCRRRCLLTLKVKSGSCPIYDHTLCSSEPPLTHECHRDDQCPGSLKCCYRCRRECTFILPFAQKDGFE
ncbi:WAP four-disulfide core domain protein 5-like [Hyperolius riggenbachi]|uniref:WAP four-disulfide core domain protein 5-like n=1 Tax=Hyperolius riggenbachi TaxID=752182 RepID=UPI0035A304A0